VLQFLGDVGSNLAAGWIAALLAPFFPLLWKIIQLAWRGQLRNTLINAGQSRVAILIAVTPLALPLIYCFAIGTTIAFIPIIFPFTLLVNFASSRIFSIYNVQNIDIPSTVGATLFLIFHISITVAISKLLGERIYKSKSPFRESFLLLVDGSSLAAFTIFVAIFAGAAVSPFFPKGVRDAGGNAMMCIWIIGLSAFYFFLYKVYFSDGFVSALLFRRPDGAMRRRSPFRPLELLQRLRPKKGHVPAEQDD